MDKQNEKLMKDQVIQRLLESEPVQEKLEEIVREWSRRTKSGKPEFDEEGLSVLREVMREKGVSPDLIDENQLTEISFTKDKYFNQPFQPRPAGANRDSSFMDTIRDEGLREPEGLLTRADEDGDAIEVDIANPRSPNEPESTYVEDESGTVYEIIYTSESALEENFLEAEHNPDSINWGADTFETAACAGLAMENAGRSPRDVKSSFENKKADADTISELSAERDFIIQILQDSSYDWEQSGVDEIVGKLQEDAPVFDLGRFLSIALGNWEFWDEQLRDDMDSPRFIHGRITDYYAAEKENENVETSGGKANTADYVITSTSADEVIERMKTEPVGYTDDGICYFVEDESVRFAQVSHKEAFGSGSQLGKFVTDFRRMFGLGDTEVLDKVVVPAQGEVIEEGFIDTVQDTVQAAADYAVSGGQTLVNMVKGGYEGFKEKVRNMLSSQVARVYSAASTLANYFSDTSELDSQAEKVVQRIRQAGIVQESEVPSTVKSLITENLTHSQRLEIMKKAWNRLPPKQRSEIFSPLYRPMDERRQFVIDHMENDNAYTLAERINSFEPLEPDEIDKDSINNLFATYQAMTALENLIRREEGRIASAREVLEDFAELQRQMVFGRTMLPLWKVATDEYKLLGSGQSYEQKKVKFLESIDQDALHLVIVKMIPQPGKSAKASWATTNFYIVDDYNEEEKQFEYTKVELRSEGHEFSFTVSGKKSGIPQSKLLDN